MSQSVDMLDSFVILLIEPTLNRKYVNKKCKSCKRELYDFKTYKVCKMIKS